PAPGIDPFANLEAISAAHDWRLFFEAKIVEVGAIPASDLEHVAKARCGNQRRLGALALRDYVDNGGAAVNEEPHLVRFNLREPDGVDHALGKVARRGQRLGYAQAACGFVEIDQISESATDIRGKPPHP